MKQTRLNPRIRAATSDDLADLDRLMARAYPALLKHDYKPSTLVSALPLITRAQPALLISGRYFVAEIDDTIVAAGGWSFATPGGQPGARGVGHVRHVVCSPDRTRQGVGRALMSNVMLHAKGSGVGRLECLSTRTAAPFYAALGFEDLGPVDLPLAPAIMFPCVAMRLQI
jgi:GNAT superfamily N-acetyltransferase